MALRNACRHTLAIWFGWLAVFTAAPATAQSICVGPLPGDGGVEEVCVNVTETGVGGATMDFRGPSPLVIPPTVVGNYTIALTATYASDGGGMAMILDGTVTRTSPGTETIVVIADGGLGTPLAFPSAGSLTLIGTATDASQTILGGAAGFPFGPTGDIQLTSLGNTTCDEVTFAAGDFDCIQVDLPVDAGTIAARNITTFQLNTVGQSIAIPSGAVVGDPPLIGQDTDVLEIEIEKARGKTVSAQAKKCSGPPLGFGPSDATAINDAAARAGRDAAVDVFGDALDAALVMAAADKDGAMCQKSVAKETSKCLATHIKEFNRCKKVGLKQETVTSATDLETCLGADPKGKIARSCDPTTGKLTTKVLPKACAGVDLASALPGCSLAAAPGVAACIEASVRCRVCSSLAQADGLTTNCDLFDDANANASCL